MKSLLTLRSLILLTIFVATAVLLSWFFLRENTNGWTTTNFKERRDPVVKEFLIKDLPTLPKKFDIRAFQKISRGKTESEIIAILGKPSDSGDETPVLQDALEGNPKLLPRGHYYLRYRYSDNTLVVLVFDKKTHQLVDYATRSWEVGPVEF